MKKIVITGANGQLGCCLKEASVNFKEFQFIFLGSDELDITNAEAVNTFFEENTVDYCINAAAYTNVEKAESDKENAFLVNAEGTRNVALACQKYQVTLVHISTDYVFDGTKESPYSESDKTKTINVYGASKLKGEEYIQEICEKYFIVRTSWLYSQFGHNFFKSILRFSKEKDSLTITTEQVGSPTNANDLANAMLAIIVSGSTEYGIYHYSNTGSTTWSGFAKAIIEFYGLAKKVAIVETDYYPTFAKRPAYSVLNTSKITKAFAIDILDWEQSLKNLIINLKE